jgi:hypothetical protein
MIQVATALLWFNTCLLDEFVLVPFCNASAAACRKMDFLPLKQIVAWLGSFI